MKHGFGISRPHLLIEELVHGLHKTAAPISVLKLEDGSARIRVLGDDGCPKFIIYLDHELTFEVYNSATKKTTKFKKAQTAVKHILKIMTKESETK